MGSFDKKTKTSSQSTGTATTTPNVPSYISGPAASYYGAVGSLVNQNPNGVAKPTSPLQETAFANVANLGSYLAPLTEAMNGTRGGLTYNAPSVSAGQIAGTDLSPYMNPYEDEVVSRSLADVDRMRQGAITAGQGAATMAGAFGGSRHGIADAETNRGYFDVAGRLAADLRSAGYANAQLAAGADIDRRFNADTFNSGQDLASAGVRMGAANQLGTQALAQGDAARADIGMQAGLGSMQREIANENDPTTQRMEYLAALRDLLGIDPSQFIGQNVATSGSASGTTKTSDPLGGIGTILQAMAALPGGGKAPSDRRLKYNIVPLGSDDSGLPWYKFSYLWDEPSVRHVGVMADEAPAHAVHRHESGFLMVDYGAL